MRETDGTADELGYRGARSFCFFFTSMYSYRYDGIANLSESSYHSFMGMKGLTIKLSDTTLRRLRQQARESGRSVAALVRERVEGLPGHAHESIFALTSDLAGSLAGGRCPAANTRRRFRRP